LRPDVTVMDRSMPFLDGLEVNRKMLAKNPHMVVLGMSMHEGDLP
jgi:DNA-binding NarL/FixJ family response regulator